MKSKRKISKSIICLLLALLYMDTTITFQFPTLDTIDISDYFFNVDLDEKSINKFSKLKNNPFVLKHDSYSSSFTREFLATLPIFQFAFFSVITKKGCRSPP
ncbi:MAG: hypothetical protein HYT97_06395 [Elusimicrobia bacterium]|nr:hypothetical protein [Elusimicrobiota bacterium]